MGMDYWGADWDGDGDYNPELQLWRSNKSGVYQKISGIHFRNNTPIPLGVYEYSDFSPIPFKAGDILGVFIPEDQESRIRLRSENGPNPVNYYIPTGSAMDNNIDIFNMQQVSSAPYHLHGALLLKGHKILCDYSVDSSVPYSATLQPVC